MYVRPAIIVAIVLSGIASASTAFAQTAADLFDPTAMQEVRLFMNSADLKQLRERYQEHTQFTVDLLWRGTRIRNAAVRSRGTGSANPVKPGLRIDFTRYAAAQRFVGLTSLVLDNLWQDASMLREHLAMAMFARMGLPAPRQAFCRLYINGQYQGVYALTEEPNAEFVARTLAEHDGYVFEYRWVMAFYAGYLGRATGPYKPLFSPRTRELEPDATLYGPIEALFRAINEPLDGAWRQEVERYIDLSQFVTHVAIESFIAEDDGVLGYAGMNNFYLYRPAGSTRHQLFPWDKDNAFQSIDRPVLAHADENELFRRAMAHADLRDLYLDVLERCARSAIDEEWLAAEIEQQLSVISDAAHSDPRKQYANDAFDEQIEFLREFARSRSGNVLAQVTALRQSASSSSRTQSRGAVR